MTRRPNAVTGLAAAKDRLVEAHRTLSAVPGADLGTLNEVLAVALELDGMLGSLGEELRHAKATAAGLAVKNSQLRDDLRAAEDELGRLRPENAVLRARVGVLEDAAVLGDSVPRVA